MKDFKFTSKKYLAANFIISISLLLVSGLLFGINIAEALSSEINDSVVLVGNNVDINSQEYSGVIEALDGELLQVQSLSFGLDDNHQISNVINILDINSAKDLKYGYYLIAGHEPENINEVVISEGALKNYIDSEYKIGSGKANDYLGQELVIYPQIFDENDNVISVEPYRFKIVGVDNSSKLNRHLNQIYTSTETLNTMVDFYDKAVEIHTYEEIILNKPMTTDEMYKILDLYNLGIDKVTPIGSDMRGINEKLVMYILIVLVIILSTVFSSLLLKSYVTKSSYQEFSNYLFKNIILLITSVCILNVVLITMLYNLAYFVKPFVILDIKDFILLIISGFIMYALSISILKLSISK